MNAADRLALRAQVVEGNGTVHAFCAAHPELKRSTVYAVLAGNYPGNIDVQAAHIRAALAEPQEGPVQPQPPGLTSVEVESTLQNIRCNHCRRLDRRNCSECRRQTEREARDLCAMLFPGR